MNMRRLLTPKWLALHAAALVLVVAFLALGVWQWHRAGQGSYRSLAYALEWPAFAAFVIFVWIREARSALRAAATDQTDKRTATDSAAASSAGSAQTEKAKATEQKPGQLDIDIPVYTPPDTVVDDDPELAAYNQYLARLNMQAQGRE